MSESAKKKKKYMNYKKTPKLSIDSEIETLSQKYVDLDPDGIESFNDLPLSPKTKRGLNQSNFTIPTAIQKQSIVSALKGDDVLGAAITGSGKTLAFIIPVLECLHRLKWSAMDGLGALIITPTRELSYQIFEVLRKVGHFHDFSAGLIIGGKHIREETDRINSTNIIVCTPGRLLQHMDETPNFNADNLQILILDEADRTLDMGFEKTMNAIIENVPTQRQTMLFSATQTKSVKDLVRLSLSDPTYISIDEKSKHSTPLKLEQYYVTCSLEQKIDMLWSFIKNHSQQKILVFFSSCKQVKFIYRAFCKLRPGVTILCLHGDLNQLRRLDVYNQFCRKEKAVLLATDIAARGLDFPSVHWVVQVDCPEDATTYVHRVGRSARREKDGEALLFLMPSEEAMLQRLNDKKVPISDIKINPKRIYSIQGKLQSLCASDNDLKESCKRNFISYLRAIFLMSDKEIFDVNKLDIDAFAKSLGLAVTPRVRFLQRHQKKLEAMEETDLDLKFDIADDDIEDVIKVKDNPVDDVKIEPGMLELPVSRKTKSKTVLAKKLLKRGWQVNTKIKFDDGEGEVKMESDEPVGINLEEARERMKAEDAIDKQKYQERIRKKHRDEKLKKKMKRKQETPVETIVELPSDTESGLNEEPEEDDATRVSRNRKISDQRETEPPDSDEAADAPLPDIPIPKPSKKRKRPSSAKTDIKSNSTNSVEIDEQIALQLLGR